ncbi:MAG: prepilin peptidase [Patescibacteria group bacterium]|nr:prepilin peptidase [Patescibacteria group bacterium]
MDIQRILLIVLAAILGGVLGSFANVLVIRWHEDCSISGRSACPKCKSRIKPRHLIPIFSWLWLRGRCAYCGEPIHIQYPIVEALVAVLAIIAAVRHDPLTDPGFWFEFLFSAMLIVPVVMDVRWQEVPVEYLIGIAGLAGVWQVVYPPASIAVVLGRLSSIAIAFAIATVFFGLQILLSRQRWLGLGDLWFALAMAGILGWKKLLVGIYLSYIIGGSVAFVGFILGRFKRGSHLPFVPALFAGTMVALWYGERVTLWFLHAIQ